MNKFQLRNYQRKAVSKTVAGYRRHNAVLLVSPTGAGKSLMGCAIAKRISRKRILFVAHRQELLKQMVEGYDGDVPADYYTVQSAHKIEDDYDLIVVDEAHHAISKSYRRLISEHPNAKVLGLTATPQRLDGKPLNDLFDFIVETPGAKSLQKKGFLVPAIEYSVGEKIDLGDIKKKAGDYNLKELSIKVRKTILFGGILKEFVARAIGRQTVVYCVDVAHCKEVAELFLSAGYDAVAVYGSLKKEDRDKALNDFKSKKIQIIVNCMLFTEGLDIPGVECVVVLRPTISLALYLQMIGRGLRVSKDKKYCIVIDHTNNYILHGTVNQNRAWRYITRERSISGGSEKVPLPSFMREILVLDSYTLKKQNTPMPMFSF